MNHCIIPYPGPTPATSAILLFAGWAAEPSSLPAQSVPEHDTILVYDYASTADPDGSELAGMLAKRGYSEICLIAWSFGVAHAARWLAAHGRSLPIGLRVAVNGTLYPVDPTRGIHPDIFSATLAGLSEVSVEKFALRMCGSREAYASYRANLPQRTLESLRNELAQMERLSSGDMPFGVQQEWDMVFVGEADRIIPARAQLAAWQGHPLVTTLPHGHHLPSWCELFNMIEQRMVAKDLVARRFGHAAPTYDANAPVQHAIARRISEELPPMLSGHIIEAGPGTGLLTRHLRQRLAPGARLTLWDLAPVIEGAECADAEQAIRIVPDESVSLIAGASVVQWFQAPARFFAECARTLAPGGMAALSTFGSRTCHQIDDALQRPASHPTLDMWESMARSAMPGCRVGIYSELHTLEFDTPADVLRHLKLTGVNARMDGPGATAAARRVINAYRQSGSRRFQLTYEPVYIFVHKPS